MASSHARLVMLWQKLGKLMLSSPRCGVLETNEADAGSQIHQKIRKKNGMRSDHPGANADLWA